MKAWSGIRLLLLALASFGYMANGAQAHVSVHAGETLNLMLCGTGSTKMVELELPGQPIEETEDTCCGDCTPSVAISVSAPAAWPDLSRFADPVPDFLPYPVSPRSPLWPGAPPQGPPLTHKT